MLEIVMSGSEKLLLQETCLFAKENIVDFSLFLCYGKIKDIKKMKTRNVCNYNISVIDTLNFLKEKSLLYKDVRIWYSSSDNEDISSLYFIINYLSSLSDFNIYICDVFDVNHFSLGNYDKSEVCKLLDKTHLLSIDEKEKYCNEWDRLESENGDLRIIIDNSMVSCDYEYLDSRIIEVLEKYDNISYWSFIVECLSLRLCNFYGDIFFVDRVDNMINRRIIEVCDIKKRKNIIGEEELIKYIRKI